MLAFELYKRRDIEPDGIAVIDRDGAHSWHEVIAQAEEFTLGLKEIGSISRALLLLPQRKCSISMLAACQLAGIDTILVPFSYGDIKAREFLAQFGGDRLLTVQNGRLISLTGGETVNDERMRSQDPAVFLLTSGSTGQPKCIRHTWTTLTNSVKRRAEFAGSRWLLGYPLGHFSGLQVLVQCLLNGGTLVIPDEFSPRAAMAALHEHGVEYFTGTPTYLRLLMMASTQADWAKTRLRHVTLGGEIVNQRILDAIRAAVPGVKVTHIYASTEFGAVISVSDGREGFDAAWIDGERFKIVDGELFIRPSSVGILGCHGTEVRSDEWIGTGDLVEAKNGRARFLGRVSDVINVGGSKVSPVSVEMVIRKVEGVVDVRVVGHRSSITGHLVKAVIHVDSKSNRVAIRREIHKQCCEQLPSYMVPRVLEFCDGPKLTVTQKWARADIP